MKILVVEDEHRIANAIKTGLTQEKGVVDVAYDGQEGYDLAATTEYDVIILDLMLPSLSGIEVCQRLRKDGVNTPILILTAKGQIEDKVLGLNEGADDYLTKPFSFAELVARVKALARRKKHVVNKILQLGDLKLDYNSYSVYRKDKPITLTSKEYTLLEYFMLHPNKILSKEQIISYVWNYDADVLLNTVEVYIKNLRGKIGNEYIKTARGFGYKLDIKN